MHVFEDRNERIVAQCICAWRRRGGAPAAAHARARGPRSLVLHYSEAACMMLSGPAVVCDGRAGRDGSHKRDGENSEAEHG
jgi:hypothetical protein